MLGPKCQVCDNFDVDRSTCCGVFQRSKQIPGDIIDFVIDEYGRDDKSVNAENFRLLNEDMRYEIVSLYEDTTVWSGAYIAQKRRNTAPACLTRVAQTSAFVHIRVLAKFLTGVNRSDEIDSTTFNVAVTTSPYVEHWLPAINNNVMHFNQLRPAPMISRKKGRPIRVPQGVHHEVAHLADEVVRLWHDFTRQSEVKPYSKLLEHIAVAARDAAQARRKELTALFEVVAEAEIWRPAV